jgi:hypothetical protein
MLYKFVSFIEHFTCLNQSIAIHFTSAILVSNWLSQNREADVDILMCEES